MFSSEEEKEIRESCFNKPKQMMLDIRPEFLKLMSTRYPFTFTGNIERYEGIKENDYLYSDNKYITCGRSIYFNNQGISTPQEIESCDYENVGKSWFIAMSLRGPFITGSAKVFRHVQGRKYKCCFKSPSEENRDMMDFCNELAHKLGIHYVTYEDLCSIDFEATDEILERFDEYIDRPNAFQMLFD